jgi:hypothetical protein
MFNRKKGGIMRHPYATLVVLGLAGVGVLSISEKAKSFFNGKIKCVGNMITSMTKQENS